LSGLIHWFRRDLRIADNTALWSAARDAERVIPVFILDDHYARDGNIGPARFRFLRESLEELAGSLAAAGSRLILRPGPASRALPELLEETGASGVYANFEIGPYPEKRDVEARSALEARGGHLRLFPDALLVEPDAVATQAGEPYTVFTPFSRKWEAAEKREPLGRPGDLTTPAVKSVSLDRVRAWRSLPAQEASPRGGEKEAGRLLREFCSSAVAGYARARHVPAIEGTSRLAAHLHFGTISPRTVRDAVLEAAGDRSGARLGTREFLRQLAWRDFFHHVLYHFPRVAGESFRREFDGFPWRENPELYEVWKRGATGYPFVDAAMRQLRSEHWMHNRGRMVVASFLTKDLHIDWRRGEAWFEHELADADLANNNGGWQWAAGTGADAAPYFRILHPTLQARKFDPRGHYIRRWLPELARVPLTRVHEPWTMSAREQKDARCEIGKDYPVPVVDHAAERKTALELFATVRRGLAGSRARNRASR